MSILFGHPTGNPNSHHAALAHYEAGTLEAFCVPWMPTNRELALLERFPGAKAWAARLKRRSFPELLGAPRVESRISEWTRLLKRAFLPRWFSPEALAHEANDWLMWTMTRELNRPGVTVIHSYEDCSLWQFREAKRHGQACIYDMPIGYYPAWLEIQNRLIHQFSEWLPASRLDSHRFARPVQKREEMELADLVLVPTTFVQNTIHRFAEKKCALASYGVDTSFWRPPQSAPPHEALRFLYVGQLSIRKATPVLLDAWRQANLKDAELHLVGPWLLAEQMQRQLPPRTVHFGPCSPRELLGHYQSSDVFVFPSFFEGFALSLLEAMACGLPVIASDSTGAPDIIDASTGRVLPPGDTDSWVDTLRETAAKRSNLRAMGKAARERACKHSWEDYRRAVSSAVSRF